MPAKADRAEWEKFTTGRAGIWWDNVIKKIWKNSGGDQDDIQSIEKYGGYKTGVKKTIEEKLRLVLISKMEEEKHLEILGELREDIEMKEYLNGPMDYPKNVKLRFRATHLGIRWLAGRPYCSLTLPPGEFVVSGYIFSLVPPLIWILRYAIRTHWSGPRRRISTDVTSAILTSAWDHRYKVMRMHMNTSERQCPRTHVKSGLLLRNCSLFFSHLMVFRTEYQAQFTAMLLFTAFLEGGIATLTASVSLPTRRNAFPRRHNYPPVFSA